MKFLAASIFTFALGMLGPVRAETPKKMVTGVYYVKELFVHVHAQPGRESAALTTVSCGHPVKVITQKWTDGREELELGGGKWYMVRVGPYEGHLLIDSLSAKRETCFQDKYPKFFDSFGLELAEMYNWGKLYDQYVTGKTRLQ